MYYFGSIHVDTLFIFFINNFFFLILTWGRGGHIKDEGFRRLRRTKEKSKRRPKIAQIYRLKKKKNKHVLILKVKINEKVGEK